MPRPKCVPVYPRERLASAAGREQDRSRAKGCPVLRLPLPGPAQTQRMGGASRGRNRFDQPAPGRTGRRGCAGADRRHGRPPDGRKREIRAPLALDARQGAVRLDPAAARPPGRGTGIRDPGHRGGGHGGHPARDRNSGHRQVAQRHPGQRPQAVRHPVRTGPHPRGRGFAHHRRDRAEREPSVRRLPPPARRNGNVAGHRMRPSRRPRGVARQPARRIGAVAGPVGTRGILPDPRCVGPAFLHAGTTGDAPRPPARRTAASPSGSETTAA